MSDPPRVLLRRPALRALLFGTALAGATGLSHWLGWGLPLLGALAALFAVVALIAPRVGVRWLEHAIYLVRAHNWRSEQGRHHSFGGVALYVQDDGRHVWLAADDLRRVLRSPEPDDVTAARHAGHWRRDDRGALLLRVDAVVAYLAGAPGRMQPRTVKLRRYLEREVLFPAAERRRRTTQADRSETMPRW